MSLPVPARFACVAAGLLICLALMAQAVGAEPPRQPAPSAAPAARQPARIGSLRAGRVLFLGNSITLHGPLAEIGWAGNWGMAASAEDKDYVHLLTARIAQAAGAKPEVRVRNIADFERQYGTFDVATGLKAEIEFKPDLVVVAIGENVPALDTETAKAAYAAAFARLLTQLKQAGSPALFVRSSFWPDPAKDDLMKRASAGAGATFIDIASLGREEANAARSERKIDHAGVAAHPGDRGMQAIADAIWAAIQDRSRTGIPPSPAPVAKP